MTKSSRLFFIDAMRAWAILMMLQGHFIDGLLDPGFRDAANPIYKTWLYFRGITAPVFFTVSGFIFTYLLIRSKQTGLSNSRIKKGVRRGLQLVLIGYLLRLNVFGLFQGRIYGGFYLVDVLHCIGLALLAIIGLYLLSVHRHKLLFPLLLLATTLVLFTFEPLYKQWAFPYLPEALANYVTKANGSVFTIIPWLGYSTIGGFLSVYFHRYHNAKWLYPISIFASLAIGAALIYGSSGFFIDRYRATGIQLFEMIQMNNYLYIRLGNVFIVFAVFMIVRSILTAPWIIKIGQNTLSIYVIHFIILYGSFTGLGLYRFFKYSLSPDWAIGGAIAFMVACTVLALVYDRHEVWVKERLHRATATIRGFFLQHAAPQLKRVWVKGKAALTRLFGLAK